MVGSAGGLTSGSTRPPATLPLMCVARGGALPAALDTLHGKKRIGPSVAKHREHMWR
jgi:hypothetical protein